MNSQPPSPAARNGAKTSPLALRSILLMLGGIVVYDVVSWFLAVTVGGWQLFAIAGIVLGFGAAAGVGLVLARQGRGAQGVALTAAAFLITLIAIGGLVEGLGVSLAVIAPVLTAAVISGNLPRRGFWAVMAAALATSVIVVFEDFALAGSMSFRAAVPALAAATPIIAALLGLAYAFYVLRILADLSLRAKLIISFLAVALVPLAVVAAFNARANTQALTDAANEALRGAAALTAQSLDAYFDNARSIVQTEAQQPVTIEYLSLPPEARQGSDAERELRAAMNTWQLRDTRARAYMLLDNAGLVLRSTSTLDIGEDHSDKDFFIQAMALGQSYVSPLRIERNSEQGDFYVSMVVRVSGNPRPLGVLVARYQAAAIREIQGAVLQNIVEQSNGLAGPESFGVLFDEYGIHLAHGTNISTTFQLAGPATAEQIAALQAQYRLPTLANFNYSSNLPELAAGLAASDGQPFFTAQDVATGNRLNQVAVVSLSTFPWKLAFFQPQDVFLAPVQRQTQATLTLAAIIALVVTGVAIAAAQVLSDPITRLINTAERVAGGDLAVRAVVGARDEIGTLARTFNGMTERLNELVSTLEDRVAERTGQLQAAADISRATASVRNLDDLLRLALELIRERFGYYHASIFLMDEAGQYAVLRESTGPVGAQLKARGHRLALGSQSLIGWITAHRQPRVALDVAEDPFHFKNPLLPDTRSELAIPLIVGDRLVGALDVQSREAQAFEPGDIQVLQTLADQLSVAIENAQLFERTEASLAEVSGLYQRLAGDSWRTLLRGQQQEAVYEPAPMEATLISYGGEPLRVPLQLRDRQVGVIEVHGRRPEQWTTEEKAALGTIAAQVAAALESAALLEETQRRRVREQLINEITYQMRATLNPTAVVHSGMRELGRALGATEVVVRLAGEASDQPAGNGPSNGPQRRGTSGLRPEGEA